MSQLAPFRQEPFFAKNGHTVPGGFAPALLLALAFALALGPWAYRSCLPPLPPALPPPFVVASVCWWPASRRAASARLRKLLVVRVRANCPPLGQFTVVTEVKADLLFCITALTLPLGSGVGLVCSGLSGCLGCGLDFRLELRKLLLGVGELARVGVCAGARGRVDGVGDGLVGRFPLLELQDHFVGLLPRPGCPQHWRLVSRPQPLCLP